MLFRNHIRARALVVVLIAAMSLVSFDAQTWNVSAAGYPADNDWEAVAYGNGVFVAVSSTGSGNRVMTSPDGISWTPRTSASDSDWQAVTFGNNLFVAVGTNAVMTSPDGTTWTSRTAVNGSWDSVAGCGGMFVAVSSVTSPYVMSSSDGITWTVRTPAHGWDHQQVACRESPLVFVSSSHLGRVWYSNDGITWSAGSQGHIVHTHAKAYGIVSGTGTFSWLEYNDYDNNQASGSISTNGSSFTSTGGNAVVNGWNSMTFGNSKFVAVAQSGSNTRAAYSSNGSIWSLGTGIPDNTWESVAFGTNTFVAVAKSGSGNRVATSTDGVSWSVQPLVAPTPTTASVSTTTAVAPTTTVGTTTTTTAVAPTTTVGTTTTVNAPTAAVGAVTNNPKTTTTIGRSSTVATSMATTTSTTVAPTTTTTIPAPTAPEASSGEAAATQNGEAVATKLTRLDNRLVIEAGGIAANVYAVNSDSEKVALNDEGVLEISSADTIVFDARGYEPKSAVEVWLNSSPIRLGSVTADSEGQISGQYAVPSSVPTGDHRVVLAGQTRSGGESVIGVGFRIAEFEKDSGFNRVLLVTAIALAIVLALVIPTSARRRRNANS